MISAREAAHITLRTHQEQYAAAFRHWQERWVPHFNDFVITRAEEGRVEAVFPFQASDYLSMDLALSFIRAEHYQAETVGFGRPGIAISWRHWYGSKEGDSPLDTTEVRTPKRRESAPAVVGGDECRDEEGSEETVILESSSNEGPIRRNSNLSELSD